MKHFFNCLLLWSVYLLVDYDAARYTDYTDDEDVIFRFSQSAESAAFWAALSNKNVPTVVWSVTLEFPV